MKKIVIQTVLLLLVSFSSMSQTASPSFFEFTGKEISISELPIIKGRWFNPLNRASNQFRYENGTLYTW